MKTHCFALIAVVFLSSVSLAQENRVTSTLDSLIIPEGGMNLIPEENIRTDNGIVLSMGRVSNGLDLAVSARNITFGGQNIAIDVIIYPNSTWTYARLNGMLIVPKTPSIINTEKTSFYPSSRQLHMSFDGTDEVDVYFTSYVSPRIVVADSNIKWGFDGSRLNIKSSDIMKEIDVYWNDETGETVYIYDRRVAESLQYRITKMLAELPKMNDLVIQLRLRNDEIRKSMASLEARIKSATAERDSMKDALIQTNTTAGQMEGKVSGSVIVGQSAFALAVIISVISLMLLVDTAFLRRRGG